ncbi:MAG: xanthine dehydrogenase family protein subunit M [Deltaproteobacteria bacterium]|nr:xanthine dehydrogenase family protein subunit M [Deltaproteobacteria bacterium]
MECRLIRPESLENALEERERFGSEAMPIAGGQSLLVMLRNKLISPTALIDLEGLAELRGIKSGRDGMAIGAMTTFYTLLSSPEVKGTIPILAQAATLVSSTAIRNLGTIGGNLCHNELGADLPPALLALNAEVELRSRRGTRTIPLAEFFRDYFETAVEPDELVCQVTVPKLARGSAGVYLKQAVTPEHLAIVGVAAVVVPDGMSDGGVSEVRLGLGGVAPVPFRAAKAEAMLRGAVVTDDVIREAAEAAAAEAEPVTDAHASGQYRRKMVSVFVRRAIAGALGQMEWH